MSVFVVFVELVRDAEIVPLATAQGLAARCTTGHRGTISLQTKKTCVMCGKKLNFASTVLNIFIAFMPLFGCKYNLNRRNEAIKQ